MSARALRRCVDPHRVRASRMVAGTPGPVRIAGVPYPPGAESRHTRVYGADAAGRRALLMDLVEQLRARGERCVIHDASGRYTQAFFDPGRDVLLNPLDTRAPGWSPFADARNARDFTAMAAALIPRQAHPLQRIRAEAARRAFARGASRLWRGGVRTNGALAKYLLRADVSRQLGRMEGAFVPWNLDAADPKNVFTVRAFLSDAAGTLRMLPDVGAALSIREWVLADREREGGCLFLSSQGPCDGHLRGLMAAWLQIALDALHWRGWRDTARVWVIVDDIASLNAVPGLAGALAGGPSFRGRAVLGVPGLRALRMAYGSRDAETIADSCGTRVVFRVADKTAAMCSARCLGRSEAGVPAGRAADGNRRAVVPPHELQCLRDLEGYLKFPGRWPVGRFRIRDRKRRRAAPRFVATRPDPSDGLRDPGGGSNTGGNGRPPCEAGGRAWAQDDRGSPETSAGNSRLNGNAAGQFNWC